MIRHLGSALTDVTYVFDEPTVGLHPHDVERTNRLLRQLRDKGNTVLVVEHEPEVIAIADHVIDLGPGAGSDGGTVCFEGTVDGLRASGTITGRHLGYRAALKATTRSPAGALEIRHATRNNLRDVSVDVPLGVLCVVTGVAGSGKSSLIHGSLPSRTRGSSRSTRRRSRARGAATRRRTPGCWTRSGRRSPGRTGSSRALFSANSEGACPICNGNGVIYTELGFMDTVESVCEECEGKRFDASVLEYRLGGRDISEVLAMSVAEALAFFGGRRGEDAGGPRDPRPHGRRRARLPAPRPAAHHALRRRAATAQAGDPDGHRRRHLRARRADRRASTWPTSSTCSRCSTGWWTRGSR